MLVVVNVVVVFNYKGNTIWVKVCRRLLRRPGCYRGEGGWPTACRRVCVLLAWRDAVGVCLYAVERAWVHDALS